MEQKKQLVRLGLPYALSLAHTHINTYRNFGYSDSEIIDSATHRRQDYYPQDLGFKYFKVLSGYEKTKENYSHDEIFSRTTIAKSVIRAMLLGISDDEILKRLQKVLIIAYITPQQNRLLRPWQKTKSLEIQLAFCHGNKKWTRVTNKYVVEYKKQLNSL